MSADNTPLTPPSTGSIKVDHRQSRSVANATIQKILKILSPLLLKPGEATPIGSPKLSPPQAASKKCRITEYQVEEIWSYRFSKTEELEKAQQPAKHKLFYFAGGGFRSGPTKEHWLLCRELSAQLPDTEVSLVSYPLAPNSPAPVSLPLLHRWYRAHETQAKAEGFRISLAGDSAGGNIALVLGIFAATEYLKSGSDGKCVLESIMAICPVVDHQNKNPQIDIVDPKDPLLSKKFVTEVSKRWKGDWELSDPRMSPMLADLTCFKKAGVKVDGVIALYDVLSPDTIEYVKLLSENGTEGEWLQWEKQIHCFPIMFSYHIHEAVEGKDWVVDVLRRRAQS